MIICYKTWLENLRRKFARPGHRCRICHKECRDFKHLQLRNVSRYDDVGTSSVIVSSVSLTQDGRTSKLSVMENSFIYLICAISRILRRAVESTNRVVVGKI
jgi:hypothetical protein